jgi:D-glycero-D-manno-heptose 1,7-bisphosphate phosphatase
MSLLLIDMDGTLRELLSGQQYFPNPKDQRIIEGAQIAIRAYKDDWIIAGITNQGGVAAGHKSMQDCIKEPQALLKQGMISSKRNLQKQLTKSLNL